MRDQPLVWDRVEWRQGDGRYRFEVAQGGLHATLIAPGERHLTLPMVAWDGLLDALAAARKTKSRSVRNLPALAGARWAKVEADDLVAAFRSGASVSKLAVAHNRTGLAIEAKLAELGLWDRVSRVPNLAGPDIDVVRDWSSASHQGHQADMDRDVPVDWGPPVRAGG